MFPFLVFIASRLLRYTPQKCFSSHFQLESYAEDIFFYFTLPHPDSSKLTRDKPEDLKINCLSPNLTSLLSGPGFRHFHLLPPLEVFFFVIIISNGFTCRRWGGGGCQLEKYGPYINWTVI